MHFENKITQIKYMSPWTLAGLEELKPADGISGIVFSLKDNLDNWSLSDWLCSVFDFHGWISFWEAHLVLANISALDLGQEYMLVRFELTLIWVLEHVTSQSFDWGMWNMFRVSQKFLAFGGRTVENVCYRVLNSDILVCLSTDTPQQVMCLHRWTGYWSRTLIGGEKSLWSRHAQLMFINCKVIFT